jgi:hypothetical protein
MGDPELPDTLRDELRAAWHRYLDLVAPLRPALHGGRGRLREPEGGAASRRPLPSLALVDRFVALHNAANLAGLVALMLDGGQVENVGCSPEYGRANFRREGGWFQHAVFGHPE